MGLNYVVWDSLITKLAHVKYVLDLYSHLVVYTFNKITNISSESKVAKLTPSCERYLKALIDECHW